MLLTAASTASSEAGAAWAAVFPLRKSSWRWQRARASSRKRARDSFASLRRASSRRVSLLSPSRLRAAAAWASATTLSARARASASIWEESFCAESRVMRIASSLARYSSILSTRTFILAFSVALSRWAASSSEAISSMKSSTLPMS